MQKQSKKEKYEAILNEIKQFYKEVVGVVICDNEELKRMKLTVAIPETNIIVRGSLTQQFVTKLQDTMSSYCNCDIEKNVDGENKDAIMSMYTLLDEKFVDTFARKHPALATKLNDYNQKMCKYLEDCGQILNENCEIRDLREVPDTVQNIYHNLAWRIQAIIQDILSRELGLKGLEVMVISEIKKSENGKADKILKEYTGSANILITNENKSFASEDVYMALFNNGFFEQNLTTDKLTGTKYIPYKYKSCKNTININQDNCYEWLKVLKRFNKDKSDKIQEEPYKTMIEEFLEYQKNKTENQELNIQNILNLEGSQKMIQSRISQQNQKQSSQEVQRTFKDNLQQNDQKTKSQLSK